MSDPTPIGGISPEAIEEALYAELQRLYESGAISSFDMSLRLARKLKERPGRPTLPDPGEPSGPTENRRRRGVEVVTRAERLVLIRSAIAAGAEIEDLQEDLVRGVTLPDGRPLRVNRPAFRALLKDLAIGARKVDRDADLGAVVRRAEVARLSRIAAKAEGADRFDAARRATETLLAYVDRQAPAPPTPLEEIMGAVVGEQVAGLLGDLDSLYDDFDGDAD